MLDYLGDVRRRLPELLLDDAGWQDVYVNYHVPYVERVWRQDGENRIYLHRILPFIAGTVVKSLWHTHAWPSAMRVESGVYEMYIGYGDATDDGGPPPLTTRLILPEGSSYEMTDPELRHNVRPLIACSAISLMVTGVPYATQKEKAPKSSHVLPPLIYGQRKHLFDFFRSRYSSDSK